jgi:hypothetical protein
MNHGEQSAVHDHLQRAGEGGCRKARKRDIAGEKKTSKLMRKVPVRARTAPWLRARYGLGGAGTSIRSASSRPRCQGQLSILPPPMRGGCGWKPPGPRRIFTPSARRESTLRRNGARSARAVLTNGRTTIGAPRPVVSTRTPGGVGVADALGLLVDGVVGGQGDEDGVGDEVPGRAGFGVLAANRAAGLLGDGGRVEEVERGGVAMTCTVQPRSWASFTQVSIAAVGPAPQATMVRMRRPDVTSGRRSWRRTVRRSGGCSPGPGWPGRGPGWRRMTGWRLPAAPRRQRGLYDGNASQPQCGL